MATDAEQLCAAVVLRVQRSATNIQPATFLFSVASVSGSTAAKKTKRSSKENQQRKVTHTRVTHLTAEAGEPVTTATKDGRRHGHGFDVRHLQGRT